MTEVAGCFGKLFGSRQKRTAIAATHSSEALASASPINKEAEPVLLTRAHHAAEPCCCSFDEQPRVPIYERKEPYSAPPAYSAGLLPKEVGYGFAN